MSVVPTIVNCLMPSRLSPPSHRVCHSPWLILLLGLLMAPWVLAGEGVRELRVGFAQDHLANDWRLAQVKELEQALAPHPHIHFSYTDARGSTAKQIQDIEDLIHAGIDVLITSPRDSVAMTPVIQQAYRQGIAVILLTRQITTDDYTTYISPNDSDIAHAAAHYLVAELGGEGRIVMLRGVPAASTTLQRSEGFLAVIDEYPKMEVVADKVANFLRNDAIRAIEEVLAHGIEFEAIYAQSDSMASGARMALKLAGIDPSELVIIGIDYISEARQAILAGEQRASFTYPTSAREAAEVVLAIAAGKDVPRDIQVPSQRVDIHNAHDVEPIF